MDVSVGAKELPVPPGRTHLALALAIVKNQPPGTNVKDYLVRMRTFIKPSKDLDVSCPEKFFDSAFFWKSAYEKSEAEQAKLLNTLYDLEQRNLSLLAKKNLTNPENTNAATTTSSIKRKQPDTSENVQSSKANNKRARSTLPKVYQWKESGTENQDAECPQDEKRTTSFMRQIYNMQSALQKRRNEKSLATNAVVLCKEAEFSVLDTIQQEIRSMSQGYTSGTLANATNPSPKTVLEGVELAFRLAYRALQRVSKTNGQSDSEQGKHQITYYLVCLFESITVALTQYCTALSKLTSDPEKAVQCQDVAPTQLKRQKSNRKTRIIARSNTSTKQKDEIAQELTNLLCSLADSLDLTRIDDQNVMEGILFVILGRVGKMLALFVFNGIQLPTEVCPTMKPPDGLVSMVEEGLSPEIAQCEAIYLVQLLKRIFLDERSSASHYSATAARFVGGMRMRLQKTLLQAVFGESESLFQEGLRRLKTPPPQDCSNDEAVNQAIPEWFTQELWTLVGWDMLGCTVSRR